MGSNGENVSEWELYAQHRQQLTQLALSRAPASGQGRLCVLGAGKCNDLDLAELGRAYAELHLVDVDASAVASAVSRQPPELRPKLFPQAPVDLALLSAKRAMKWKRKPPNAGELESGAATTRQDVLRRLPGPFD